MVFLKVGRWVGCPRGVLTSRTGPRAVPVGRHFAEWTALRGVAFSAKRRRFREVSPNVSHPPTRRHEACPRRTSRRATPPTPFTTSRGSTTRCGLVCWPSAVAHLGGSCVDGSGGIPGSGSGHGRPGRGEDVQVGVALHIFTPRPLIKSWAFLGIAGIVLGGARSIAVKMCKRGWGAYWSGHRSGLAQSGSTFNSPLVCSDPLALHAAPGTREGQGAPRGPAGSPLPLSLVAHLHREHS